MDLRTSFEFPPMPEDVEFGVIAGTASFNYVSKDWIAGEDDGWVGLQSTKLEGMRDFVEVSASHGMITSNDSVADQVIYFLNHGHFASNIEMKGTPVDADGINRESFDIDKYVNGINSWYKRVFKDEDEGEIETARETIVKEMDGSPTFFEKLFSEKEDEV